MKEHADKIQLVMNTLETIVLTGSYENMNKMMGIYATLAEVRDALKAAAANVNESMSTYAKKAIADRIATGK